MKICKGDTVKVISGKDLDRTAKVEKVFPEERKILVAGVNIIKKHVKPRREGEKGGIVEMEKPIAVSNVMLVCPKCKQPTRVGYQLEGKRKFRVCKKCGQEI